MLNADLIIGGASLAITALAFFTTRELSPLGGVFVNYVLTILVVLSSLIFIKGFVRPDRIAFFESVMERNNVLMGVAILAVYLIILPLVGFLPASFCFYFVMNLYLADDRFSTKNLIVSALLSAVVVIGFYLVFHYFLEVPLPEGSWFQD